MYTRWRPHWPGRARRRWAGMARGDRRDVRRSARAWMLARCGGSDCHVLVGQRQTHTTASIRRYTKQVATVS
eukprot:15469862-Alexandrium_andersonii.AAC.1